jgi:glycosyltransferase involved in cell wall biosynthesis
MLPPHGVCPRVTVVVAAYRSRPQHLRTALRSALAQTERSIEVLVRDDSPDDRLRAVVDAERDARLHYRHNAPTLGVSANHWHAFEEARGEFIAVLNHDDVLEPLFVERLAGALRGQPQATMAFCDHWLIDAAGQRLSDETERNSRHWGRATLRAGLHRPCHDLVAAQSIPVAMGALFRRAALPSRWPTTAGPAYDLWLSYLLARNGAGAFYIPERLSSWRTHDANLTSAAGIDWLLGSTLCWEAVSADAEFAAVHPQARRKASLGHGSCAKWLWRSGRRPVAIQHALRAKRNHLTLRSATMLALTLLPRRALHAPGVSKEAA